MLFDELDIERQLAPDWVESRLYCNSVKDGTTSIEDIALGAAGAMSPMVAMASAMSKGTSSTETPENPSEKPSEGTSEEKTGGENVENRTLATDSKEEKAEAAARWSDQCFIIEGWHEIVSKFKRCKKEAKSGYRQVIPILAESSQVVSVLANRTNVNLFFSLSPAQLAMLVPSIRLFIVRYKQNGNSVSESKSAELYLDDHTPERVVQKIMNAGGGRAEAIGLENFSYEFDGKDPATTNSLVKSSLKLIFNSFDTLTRKQDNGASFLELLTREKMYVSKTAAKNANGSDIYKACKEPSSGDKKATEAETTINPRYKRIKASVGWALPPGNLFFELFPKELQQNINTEFKIKVRNMLESLKLHLFLEMTDYDLNFRNDGKVELSINYRASVEGELNESRANIFWNLENRVSAHKKKKDAEKEKRKKKSKKETEEKTKATDDEEEKKEIQKEAAERSKMKDATAERNSLWNIWHNRTIHYSDFIDELDLHSEIIHLYLDNDAKKLWKGARSFGSAAKDQDGDVAGSKSAGEILRSIFDGDKTHGQFVSFKGGMPSKAELEKDKERRAKNPSKEEQEKALKEQRDAGGDGAHGGGDVGSWFTGDEQEALEKTKKKIAEKQAQERAGILSSLENTKGQRSIRITFLGDILDMVMNRFARNFAQGGQHSSVRIITSQIMFQDPAATVAGDKRRASMNIADIPISYDEFLLWWNNNITRPGRTNYPVLEFIKDLMTDLVFTAFGYNCVGGAPGIVPNLNYTLFEAPRLENGSEPLKRGLRYGGIAPLRKIKDLMNLTLLKDPEEHVSYLILHGSARSFVNRKADMLENDEKDGIYHLGLGLDRGILKEIKFTGNTLKYATETRVIEDNQSGIDQLFKKFDADVSLYGCPIFRNGQYLFLDPKTMGVDSLTARRVGLGGYYVIYNVAGELSRSEYSMELKCKFQGSGLCPDDSVDASKDLCAMEWWNEFMDPFEEILREQEEQARAAAAKKEAERKERESEDLNKAVEGLQPGGDLIL